MRDRLTGSLSAALAAVVATVSLVSFAACHDDPTSVGMIDQLPLFQTVVVTDIAAIDLGTLPPSTASVAMSINEAGQISGWSDLGSGNEIAFLWEDGAASELVGLGGTRTFASAISEVGQVVGYGRPTTGSLHAIVWNGAALDLQTLGGRYSHAYGINDAVPAQVVGGSEISQGGPTHAFLWTTTDGMQDIHPYVCTKCTCSIAFDINDAGQIVGTNLEAFVWSNAGGLQILPGLEAGSYSVAFSINEAGQVAGMSTIGPSQHAVLWEIGESGYVVRDLGTGSHDHSVASDVNEAGQVVGRGSNLAKVSACSGPAELVPPIIDRPLLWYDETTLDLGTLEDMKAVGEALALNDAGDVVGWSSDGSATRAVRWSIDVLPATPEEVTEEIIDEVRTVVAVGDLSEGRGNALLKKLDAITRKLNDGQIKAAANLLEAFVEQVEAYVAAGILTGEQGNALMQLAQDAIALLNP